MSTSRLALPAAVGADIVPSGAIDRVVKVAYAQLADVVDQSGWILYSAAQTLKPGAIYLLGNNPGGDPTHTTSKTLRQSIEGLTNWTTNAYLDEAWRQQNGVLKAGQAPMQRRVDWLMGQLGVSTRDVCASNVVFARSINAEGIHFRDWADRCWPVHQAILEIVKPRLIIAFGSDPYKYVKEQLQATHRSDCDAGHGSWKCVSSETPLGLAIIGVPHLSRYNIRGKTAVIQWIGAMTRR